MCRRGDSEQGEDGVGNGAFHGSPVFYILCFCAFAGSASCVHQIQMSPSLPFRNVTAVGVGRRAGAEPQRSAAPDRRPIERSSKPHHLSAERAPARSARRAAQPTLNRRASRWSRRRGARWLRCCGSRPSCWSRIIANTAPSRLLSAIAPWSTCWILSKVR